MPPRCAVATSDELAGTGALRGRGLGRIPATQCSAAWIRRGRLARAPHPRRQRNGRVRTVGILGRGRTGRQSAHFRLPTLSPQLRPAREPRSPRAHAYRPSLRGRSVSEHPPSNPGCFTPSPRKRSKSRFDAFGCSSLHRRNESVLSATRRDVECSGARGARLSSAGVCRRGRRGGGPVRRRGRAARRCSGARRGGGRRLRV